MIEISPEPTYIVKHTIVSERQYNENYGDDRVCKCGHTYYRHFDSYEDMEDAGCKYCGCHNFEEDLGDTISDKADAMRYRKLRHWMSSNVKEGWNEVERLGSLAVWMGRQHTAAVRPAVPVGLGGVWLRHPGTGRADAPDVIDAADHDSHNARHPNKETEQWP